jgi:hypothetical protein
VAVVLTLHNYNKKHTITTTKNIITTTKNIAKESKKMNAKTLK